MDKKSPPHGSALHHVEGGGLESSAKCQDVAALSKKIHAYAKLGLKSEIEQALAQGALLEKANVRGESATVAAMKAGHRPLAQWLFEQARHPWRAAGTLCEFFAAMEMDDPSWLAWLHAKRPGAFECRESSGEWMLGRC